MKPIRVIEEFLDMENDMVLLEKYKVALQRIETLQKETGKKCTVDVNLDAPLRDVYCQLKDSYEMFLAESLTKANRGRLMYVLRYNSDDMFNQDLNRGNLLNTLKEKN